MRPVIRSRVSAIGAASFTWARKSESIATEAALDGFYIIRTSVPANEMDAPTCVRNCSYAGRS